MQNVKATPESAREEVVLREIAAADLPTFYRQQLDPDAIRMAAFVGRDPADRAAFDPIGRKS